ncbi:MAG: CspA family cold shock protein [Candidatus Azotimanducaceae bacterium]|jgi:CspA family cold shock protein
MQFIKKFIIAIIIGFLAYELTKVLLDDGLQLPTTTPEISLLLIFIVTALAGSFFVVNPGGLTRSSSTRASSTSSASSEDHETGTVKWFNVRKGYGFITRDQGEDIFVHFRNIEGKGRRAILEGERVSFIVTDGDKGLQADNVSPV